MDLRDSYVESKRTKQQGLPITYAKISFHKANTSVQYNLRDPQLAQAFQGIFFLFT